MGILLNRLRWMKTYKANAKLPETEQEIFSWLFDLADELSPDNLNNWGELTEAQTKRKEILLKKEWVALEDLLGRKVSEKQVLKYMRGE